MSSQVPGRGKWQGRISWLLCMLGSIPAIRWLVTWFKPLAPSVPGIKDDEKAKLDYEHDMKLREIGLDKGCFAVVLAVIGATGIYCGNKKLDEARQAETIKLDEARQAEAFKLEQFRTKEAGARALLDKQMPELTAINTAVSEVTRVYFDYATGRRKTDDEQKVSDEYRKALGNAREVINRSMFLFDLDFNKDLDRYHAVHDLLRRLPIKEWSNYLGFSRDLSNQFDTLCRSVVEGQRSDPMTRFHMPLDPIAPEERDCLTPQKCLAVYLKYWNEHKDGQAAH